MKTVEFANSIIALPRDEMVLHTNKQVTVNFPNGRTGVRNCTHTIIPAIRIVRLNRFPAYGDFYAKTDYALLQQNVLRKKIKDFESFREYDRYHFKRTCLIVSLILIILALGVYAELAITSLS